MSAPTGSQLHDRELIQQLLDDIGIVDEQFLEKLPKPSAARAIFAPILRRWIAEGLFFKAQKLVLPLQVSFPISDNEHAVKLCELGMFEHWMGLVAFDRFAIATSKIAEDYLRSGGKPVSPLGSDTGNAAPQKASTFFNQKMFFWKDKFYTRVDVIKMHANSLGGVHFDYRRTQDEAYIDEIKNYFGFELKGNSHQMLLGNEIGGGRADPARRQQIYDATELIAIDTVRIFASGVRASEKAFAGLLV